MFRFEHLKLLMMLQLSGDVGASQAESEIGPYKGPTVTWQ